METELTELMVEQDLLVLLEPSFAVREAVAVPLADEIMIFAESAAFDDSRRAVIANTRLLGADGVPILRDKFGSGFDPELADLVIALLIDAGLAGIDEDVAEFVKMPQAVADQILVLLGQLVPKAISTPQTRHLPVSDGSRLDVAIQRDPRTSLAPLALLDLVSVEANVEDIPLSEILAFRLANKPLLDRYLEDLEAFARRSERASVAERADQLAARSGEIRVALSGLQTRRRLGHRGDLALGFGILAAGWAVIQQDPVMGALSLGVAVASHTPRGLDAAGPYEFVLRYAHQTR